MNRRCLLSLLVILSPLLFVRSAAASPWTKDQGSFYVNLAYAHISADSYYTPSFDKEPIRPYTQHAVGLYAQVGVVDRWLTMVIDGTLYRRGTIEGQGQTEGLGDLAVGAWTGLMVAPVHLAAGLSVGLPTGDPSPEPGGSAARGADLIAASLPTGDGEVDVKLQLAVGEGFGGGPWPLQHYALAQAGYWLRTEGFSDAITYSVELGTKAPYSVLDRLWLIARVTGVESFASQEEAASSFSGLGNGVTYTSWGVEAVARVWRGLALSFGFDGAFRARSLPAAANIRAALSYEL